ncbi:MAG: formylmethanofuran dehydrogenase, partial [Dehalococcoidales bacterium]|nr:formylmethanofuran dehydrogenase [Dehalococcoidales bacterium]
LWEKAVAFHGHECPGLAIGFKACEAAFEKMGIGISDDEQIVCITENDACGVDAVQALLSCTMGKGNLIYRGTGKQAFSFYNRTDGKKLRVCLKVSRKDDVDRTKWKEYLLGAPVDEIFSFSEPKIVPPEKARLFQTLVCEVCGEGAPEHKMRIQNGKTVCLDCFETYDRGW